MKDVFKEKYIYKPTFKSSCILSRRVNTPSPIPFVNCKTDEKKKKNLQNKKKLEQIEKTNLHHDDLEF